ncbi:Uncharacterised protein [Mycobacteroides abscessus subsp. abscessus]|nr:Uncharacterised protein [Mycobacteroides abscessus subsp. abscessus]
MKVNLDPEHFKLVQDFDARFAGPIGLREATSFTVQGDWSFGTDVSVVGAVELPAEDARRVDDGTVLRG